MCFFCYLTYCSNFDPLHLCFQGLTVAVETCSVASTGTLTSTTVPMITRLRLPPRSARRIPWWWLTRSREYRCDKTATAEAATMTTPLTKTGVWVWTFWNEHWLEWLSDDWKDLIYKITTSRKMTGGKKKKKRKDPVWGRCMNDHFPPFLINSLVCFIQFSVVWLCRC